MTSGDPPFDTDSFDQALIRAAFDMAAHKGWAAVTVAAAAQAAGLDLGVARRRFRDRHQILRRFGRMIDAEAVRDFSPAGTIRDQLFDLLMRRFDSMQPMRAGINALLRTLPADPATGAMLTAATVESMAWLLDVACVPTAGMLGRLRVKALCGVWVYALHSFADDQSPDLAATMAALDRALQFAERWATRLDHGHDTPRRAPQPFPDSPLAADDDGNLLDEH